MNYSIRLDENHGNHRKKKVNCPYCNSRGTWVRYYDFNSHAYLPERFGRCDREHSCGVHMKPPSTNKDGKQNRLSSHLVGKSLNNYDNNAFTVWIASMFGHEEAIEICARYNVGTTKDGRTVFWQVDRFGGVRSGKVMKYKPDGHRDKSGQTWVHSILELENFELEQCLFGEHLLSLNPELPVVIFESEKTAILYELYQPDQFVSLACGTLNGLGGKSLNRIKVKCLVGRDVVLFPDASGKGQAFSQWSNLAKQMNEFDIATTVQNLDNQLCHQHRQDGLDYGDVIVCEHTCTYPDELRQSDDPTKLFYFPF